MKRQIVILILLPVLALGQSKLSSKFNLRFDSSEVKIATLNRIFKSDTIKIIANSNGCFHSTRVFFYFFKSNGGYNVKCLRRDSYDIENPSCSHLPKLYSNDLAKLQDALTRGIKADAEQYFCTTRNDFEISSKLVSVAFKDLRCSQTDDVSDFLEKLVQLKCNH